MTPDLVLSSSLVLVLLLVMCSATITCPDMCRCQKDPTTSSPQSLTAVTCGDNLGQDLVNRLGSNTSELSLRNLSPEQLVTLVHNLTRAQPKLTDLHKLTLVNSNLTEWTLSSLVWLRSINLRANNGLRNVTTKLFGNDSRLDSLDLSNNIIANVSNKPFRTLNHLQTLNLSANVISTLQSETFSGLGSLKCLDLSNNSLSDLNDTVFTGLSNLQYLNLSRNRLRVLNEKCLMTLSKLQQLDVSWNHLVHIELGSLQLPGLARLMLAGNWELGVAHEPPFLVGTGQRLQTVDASRIGLQQVPTVLTHSIRTLRLAGNSIRTVRCGDLDSYPLLQLLDFKSNGLEQIEDDALGRLDCLSVLYLTDNKLKEIPRSLSETLKVLHLEHNSIETLGNKDFQGLDGLEVLLLNDNHIQVVHEEAFSQLVALATLDLSRNPIKSLPAGCLSGPAMLQVLRLAQITVSTPAKEVSFPLSATEGLIVLDLSGSPSLAKQLLVDTAALAASRQLQELDLSRTELDSVRSDLLHFLPQLRMFRVDGNPINCTGLQWLAKWMRRQDQPSYREVTCASPPDLWGTLLIDLQETEIMSYTTKLNSLENNAKIPSVVGLGNNRMLLPVAAETVQFIKDVETGKSDEFSKTSAGQLEVTLAATTDRRRETTTTTTTTTVIETNRNQFNSVLSDMAAITVTNETVPKKNSSSEEQDNNPETTGQIYSTTNSNKSVLEKIREQSETLLDQKSAKDAPITEAPGTENRNTLTTSPISNLLLHKSELVAGFTVAYRQQPGLSKMLPLRATTPVAEPISSSSYNGDKPSEEIIAQAVSAIDSENSFGDTKKTKTMTGKQQQIIVFVAAAILGSVTILMALAAKWRRRRLHGPPIRLNDPETDEVQEGLPNVTELW